MERLMAEKTPFDSTAGTLAHIQEVNNNILKFVQLMLNRAQAHDASKLGPVEKPHFDRETQKLKELTYGSDEYKASLKRLGIALEHHYMANDHHPEHFTAGVSGMNLMQVVEMFCDWVAASKRNAGSTLDLETSFERFGFNHQLAEIFRNTANALNIPVKE